MRASIDKFSSATGDQVITLPGAKISTEILFSPDFANIYYHTNARSLNLWSVVAAYWSSIILVLTVFALLLVCRAFYRLVRFRYLAGEHYCTKCMYWLRGISQGYCPECGTPIIRPAVGQQTWRRFAFRVAPLLILTGGLFWLWGLERVQSINPRTWFSWWSYSAAKYVEENDIEMLAKHVVDVDRIIEFDVREGRVTRNLFTGIKTVPFMMRLTPNGRKLLVAMRGFDLACVDVASAKIERHISTPPTAIWRSVAGIGSESDKVLLRCSDGAQYKFVVCELKTNAQCEFGPFVEDSASAARLNVWPPVVQLMSHSEPFQYLEVASPNPPSEYSYTIRRFDDFGQLASSNVYRADAPPILLSAGEFLGLSMQDNALMRVDGETFQEKEKIAAPRGHVLYAPMLVDQDKGRIFVRSANKMQFGFLILDVAKWKWTRFCPTECNNMVFGAWTSANGRFLAAFCTVDQSKQMRIGDLRIVINDLEAKCKTLSSDLDYD